MCIDRLFNNELCEDEDKRVISRMISFIKNDGFDVRGFSLTSIENYTWEFTLIKDATRGFLLYYNPFIVNQPVPQYQLYNGCVYFSFNARNITEAYIQHNKSISDEDYVLLSNEYPIIENTFKEFVKEMSLKYGYEVTCDIFNCTKRWLNS